MPEEIIKILRTINEVNKKYPRAMIDEELLKKEGCNTSVPLNKAKTEGLVWFDNYYYHLTTKGYLLLTQIESAKFHTIQNWIIIILTSIILIISLWMGFH